MNTSDSRSNLNQRKKTTHHIFLILLVLLIGETAWTIFVRETITPIPPGDGPIQTMNWLTRIEGGELAGRDFQIFHGIGVILSHLPAHLAFGGGVQGALLSFFATSAFFVISLFTLASFSRKHTKTGLLVPLIISLSAYLLLSCAPWLVAKIVLPGHSMIACRAAMGLIAVFVFHKLIALSWLRHALTGGIIAGACCFFSLDQGLAVLAGISTFICATAWQKALTLPKLALQGVLLLGSSAISLILITSIACLGNPFPQLEYSLVSLPGDQMWFFGGPPNPFVKNIFSIFLEPSFLLVFGIWSICFLILFKNCRWNTGKLRNHNELPLLLGLLFTGLFSYLSKLGMNSDHYQTSLFLGSLASLLVLVRSSASKVINKNYKFATSAIIFIMLSCGLITYKRARKSEMKGVLVGRDLDQLRSISNNGNLKVWSTYRGISEQNLKLPRLSRWDYIIHALGKNNETDYVKAFTQSNPDVVRTIKPDGFAEAPANSQWLWHTRYAFFSKLIYGWQPEKIGETYIDWVKRHEIPPSTEDHFNLLIEQTTEGFKWTVNGDSIPKRGQILIFSLSFDETSSLGTSLGGKKFARRIISTSTGILDSDSFAVPPSGLGYDPFRWAFIADGQTWPSGDLKTIGPLNSPKLKNITLTLEAGQILKQKTLIGLLKKN